MNVIFKGSIDTSFYMARLDSRVSHQGDIYDCILFSPAGNTGWHVCNKAKGESGHRSPVGERVNMKLICTKKTATLIVNGYRVDMVDTMQTKMTGKRIVIFTEEASAYIQKNTNHKGHLILCIKALNIIRIHLKPPNHALQVTPLARPVAWRFLSRRLVLPPTSLHIYSARVKARHVIEGHFTASVCRKPPLHERPKISRAEYTCQRRT
ncbi:hypothetical protein [Candidatus Chlorohelix sp.]|uniref:hypothetical protein n=1 Tax=Candidatus Chlorohelix sp. TaxID=3139201 RepID=UPI00303C17B9